MVRILQKRATSGDILRLLWETIRTIKGNRQIPSLDRIVALVRKKYNHLDGQFIADQIKLARHDNLIDLVQKSSKSGDDTAYYKIAPPKETEREHDWYCFECHTGGEVVACDRCPRVFHATCLPNNDWVHSRYLSCPVCELLDRAKKPKRVSFQTVVDDDEQSGLNALLAIVVARLKSKFNDLGSLEPKEEFERTTYRRLVFFQMDLGRIARRAQQGSYEAVEGFKVDLQTILHCVAVENGPEALPTERAKTLIEYAKKELHDVTLCPQCYRMRHEKSQASWFCEPCYPPHLLVLVRREDSPGSGTHSLWPAKVLRRSKHSIELAYFGSYELAKVSSKDVQRADSVDNPDLCPGVKRTPQWNRAYEEMLKCKKKTELKSSMPSSFHAQPQGGGTMSSSAAGSTNNDQDSLSEESLDMYRSGIAKRRRISSIDGSQTSGGHGVERAIQTDGCSVVFPVGDSGGAANDAEQVREEMWRHYETKLKEVLEEERNKHERTISEKLQKLAEEKDRLAHESLAQSKRKFDEELDAKLHDAKLRQWCRNCWKEAIYHCCWNCSYCSKDCQNTHWYREHRTLCKRKPTAPRT